MEISYCTLTDVGSRTGTVVVVDVIRAYTTAAVALAAGAGPYELVGTLEEAYDRRAADPSVRLLGEVDGLTAEGFDHGNSPSALQGVDLTGVPVVHRSSAGTQGVVRAVAADRVLAASFAVAGATAAALAGEQEVSFCVTGADAARDGEEDRACAEYIAALLADPDRRAVDPDPYLARVRASTAAQMFTDGGHPDLPPADIPFVQVIDRHDFAMEVVRYGGRHLLQAIRGVPPEFADG